VLFAALREGLADLGHTYAQLTACLGGAYAEAPDARCLEALYALGSGCVCGVVRGLR